MKKLSNGLKRSFYWNNYQDIPANVIDQGTNILSYLVRHFKVLEDYLFLLMLLLQMMQIIKQK